MCNYVAKRALNICFFYNINQFCKVFFEVINKNKKVFRSYYTL